MRRAGKGEEACRREPRAKNVGVCRFGAGVGESQSRWKRDKKRTRTAPKAGVLATLPNC